MPKKRSVSKKLEDTIIENLIELQKIHTNLASKFDNLSDQIATLLLLFEKTAKDISSQSGLQINEKDKEFLNKIDTLLEQNKVIAKGLTLMEARIRERAQSPPQEAYQPSSIPPEKRPLPRF